MNLFHAARNRPLFTAIAIAAVATVVVGVLVWFQPQKLVVDSRVDEALPDSQLAGNETPGTEKEGSTSTPRIEVVGEGSFRALAHPVSGRAKLLELERGGSYLRLEQFSVENGPDLRVYLSAAAADSQSDAFDDDFIDLGALKGNVGDQNYRIPADAPLARFQSAVIWCRRFSVGFAVAPLDN